MSLLVADCPRCNTKRTTFDIKDTVVIRTEYGWQAIFEAPSVCRTCGHFTVFVLTQESSSHSGVIQKPGFFRSYDGSANDFVRITGFVNLKDLSANKPPDHLPEEIAKVFREGATCLAVGCPNAAGAMFRSCVDMATRALLPPGEVEGLNSKIRRDLGLRLHWLFQHGLLAKDLESLSRCIREDGNDGAHAGILSVEDAQDLVDFIEALLERLYTEPARLKIAEDRRDARRKK